MQLIKRFAGIIKRGQWFQAGEPVVVAVSTGVDSMVLLALLQRLRYQRPEIIVAHVNHHLREQSNVEAAFIRNYCQTHHLRLQIADWPVEDHPQTGVEEAARLFRYRFFERVLRESGARVLMLAHHQNDQAETVLMKLIRGGDLSQLMGMRPVRQFAGAQLIRPLLDVPKRQLVAFAEQNQLTWYEDATNQSDEVLRNRVRHHLLPAIQRENPNAIAQISSYADQLASLEQSNRSMATQLLEQLTVRKRYSLVGLLKLPPAVQASVLAVAVQCLQLNKPLSAKQRNDILAALNQRGKPQGEFPVNRHLKLVKSYDWFWFNFRQNVDKNGIKKRQTMVRLNHWYQIDKRVQLGLFDPTRRPQTGTLAATFALTPADWPLTVRPAESSDRIRLGNGHHQRVARILIDQKVPNEARATAQVLVSARGMVLALIGYKHSVLATSVGQVPTLMLMRTKIERRIP